MDTVDKIVSINSRLEHLEAAAEWIARETVHSDNTISQTSTLIQVLVDDVRERLFTIIREFETQLDSLTAEMH